MTMLTGAAGACLLMRLTTGQAVSPFVQADAPPPELAVEALAVVGAAAGGGCGAAQREPALSSQLSCHTWPCGAAASNDNDALASPVLDSTGTATFTAALAYSNCGDAACSGGEGGEAQCVSLRVRLLHARHVTPAESLPMQVIVPPSFRPSHGPHDQEDGAGTIASSVSGIAKAAHTCSHSRVPSGVTAAAAAAADAAPGATAAVASVELGGVVLDTVACTVRRHAYAVAGRADAPLLVASVESRALAGEPQTQREWPACSMA
jgi:hypothetical protein